jgi:2-polyprenyl-6-hydroxyphenyl methylase/3-demethylubiquinone-9 3-methyltransferase
VSYHDEIWGALPRERALDPAVVAFALGVVAGAPLADGPPRVLDLGCGDGAIAAKLAAGDAAVTGVDPSREALERARRAHPGLALASPAADGGLPFTDASFDAVVCLHVLEHVADTQRLLSEARRVLVAGGSLAVAVPWHGRLKNVAIALGAFERHHDPLEPVLRFYTPRSLRSLVRAFGFDDVRTRAAGGRPLLRRELFLSARRAGLAG